MRLQQSGPLGNLFLFVGLGVLTAALAWMSLSESPSQAPVEQPLQAQPAYFPGLNTGADAQLVEAGDEAAQVELRYQNESLSFELHLSQEMQIIDEAQELDSTVNTEIRALVVLEPSEDPSLTFLSFKEFELAVKADGDDVEIPAVASLLAGIQVQIEFDERSAIGKDTTIAGVNPQVKRMISLLVDALRQTHPHLPEAAVGAGAVWTTESKWENEGHAALVKRHFSLEAMEAQEAQIAVRLELQLDAAEGLGKGQGELVTRMDRSSGEVVESKGQLSLVLPLAEGGEQRFDLKMELVAQ